MRTPTKEDAFRYLDSLRDQGVDMRDGAMYLRVRFPISNDQADKFLDEWRRTN